MINAPCSFCCLLEAHPGPFYGRCLLQDPLLPQCFLSAACSIVQFVSITCFVFTLPQGLIWDSAHDDCYGHGSGLLMVVSIMCRDSCHDHFVAVAQLMATLWFAPCPKPCAPPWTSSSPKLWSIAEPHPVSRSRQMHGGCKCSVYQRKTKVLLKEKKQHYKRETFLPYH